MQIDNFLNTCPKVKIKNGWFVAKPLNYWTISRFKEAWDVFIGKALAMYFEEDKNESHLQLFKKG